MKSSPLTITKLLPAFETRKQVCVRRQELIRALEGGDHAATKLARDLIKCADGEPCGSPMCPVCIRGLRESFVLGVNMRVRELRRVCKFPISAFSAVLTSDKYRVGKLNRADLTLINKRLQRQYQREGLPLVFAGIDISLNEDGQRRKRPFWQLQAYGVVVGRDAEAVKQALKRRYPSDRSTPRPFRARECTNLSQAASYAIKPGFVRRVSYVDDQEGLNTRKVSLKRPEIRELATWLDQYPLSARYLLTGCRRSGGRMELQPGVKEKICG